MFNVVIFGAPGSGKGTQSDKIVEKYGLVHLSTGDILRAEIAKGSEVGKIADGLISKGQFVPDDVIITVLDNAIDKYPIIWALHSADTKASHFMESVTGNLAAYANQPGAAFADQPTMAEGADPVFEEATPV